MRKARLQRQIIFNRGGVQLVLTSRPERLVTSLWLETNSECFPAFEWKKENSRSKFEAGVEVGSGGGSDGMSDQSVADQLVRVDL